MTQIHQHTTSSTPRESDEGEARGEGRSVANALLLILGGVAIIAFVLVALG